MSMKKFFGNWPSLALGLSSLLLMRRSQPAPVMIIKNSSKPVFWVEHLRRSWWQTWAQPIMISGMCIGNPNLYIYMCWRRWWQHGKEKFPQSFLPRNCNGQNGRLKTLRVRLLIFMWKPSMTILNELLLLPNVYLMLPLYTVFLIFKALPLLTPAQILLMTWSTSGSNDCMYLLFPHDEWPHWSHCKFLFCLYFEINCCSLFWCH